MVDNDKFKVAWKTVQIGMARLSYEAYVEYVHRGSWEPARHHKYICEAVQDVVNGGVKRLMINMPPRHGKQVADDTPILTTNGWKTHGELRVGDYVYSPSGNPVKVTCVHQPQTEDLLVTFSNGERIHCHPRHEWVVYDVLMNKYVVRETRMMKNSRLSHGAEGKRGHKYRYKLPIVKPIVGETKQLHVHPYVLGVWLGDGTNTKPAITGIDQEINTEILKHHTPLSYNIHKITGVYTWYYAGLRDGLHKYGMCIVKETVQKRIPNEYYLSSIEQRLDLLAGLIDSDGYCSQKENRYRFINSDKALIDDVVRLIATFGWRVCITSVPPVVSSSGIVGTKTIYQVGFTPTLEIPCRLERKQIKPCTKQRRVSIVSIEQVEEKIGRCITVEGGIYLVGNTLLPTHNSMTITETLPSWFLGKNPDKRAMVLSYSDEFSSRFGRYNREKILEFGKQIFGVELARNNSSATNWTLQGHRGGLLSKSFGGTVTGEGASLLIIDDPVKNREEAESATMRDKVFDEFQNTAATRLAPDGAIIIIQTRWHEDDLSGRLLAGETKDRWKVISIPAVAEQDDLLGRAEGELLWPEYGFDEKWAENTKLEVGSYAWSALYQQRPSPAGGGIFNRGWWKRYDADYPPVSVSKIISVDAAFKDTATSDYVSIQTWGKRDTDMFLLDKDKRRMDFPTTLEAIRAMHKKHHPRAIFIEDKANGSAIISILRKEIPGVIAVNPSGGKVARAHAVSAAVQAGNVHIPTGYLGEELIDECASFPMGKYDDDVDAMTQALNQFIYHWAPIAKATKRRVKWTDDQYEDYYRATADLRAEMIEKWGDPFGLRIT